jgi:chemotaxis signal transduction protein
MSIAFVLFRLGERTFASRLDDVREIARLGGLQRLPGTNAPLSGLVMLRGAPLPVFDVRDGEAAGDADGDVLVLDTAEGPIGVAVDKVVAVVPAADLPESDAPVRTLPSYVVGVRRHDSLGAWGHDTIGAWGHDDDVVLLVDVQLLLDATRAGWDSATG